jgi:hypothetical protein
MIVSHIRERINAAFSDIVFDQKKHLYYVDDENYPSVTRKIENCAPKFDANLMAPLSAIKASRIEKREVTEHEMKYRWQTINKLACDLGHETHDFMEHYTGIETPRTPQEKAGVKFFSDMSTEYEVIFRENRMYSRRFKFAGTDDLLLIHRLTGEIIVGDYKTNGDLFKCYKGQTLLAPFDYLESTPYNKYQLQLSYYQLMLEEIGIKVSGRKLIYLKADATYRIFDLIDITAEIIDFENSKQIAA